MNFARSRPKRSYSRRCHGAAAPRGVSAEQRKRHADYLGSSSICVSLSLSLSVFLLDAVHTAYSLKTYSCDSRQRGKTQPACVNSDSHLAFSSTASHPHTLVIGISFVHLSLRLFSIAHHLYGVTIITPTWKRKR